MIEGPLISLGQYLDQNKSFEIPNYQRGYVWGKKKRDNRNNTDSVTFFINSLISGFTNKNELFLQGVTVSEKIDKTIIIDGQQRTTLLYLIMVYLGKAENFTIHYAIREESNKFLQELKIKKTEELLDACTENEDEEYQDIYYFKKSVRIINLILKDQCRNDLYEYLVKQVKFLYIDIGEADATSIFTMMNGNKADMLAEEVIKADLLRLVSLPRPEREKDEGVPWETNMVRSKYAREWDKWLHWWNQKDVQCFYGTNNTMGLLISSLYNKREEGKLSYEIFKREFLEKEDKIKAAKDTFYELRQLQKKFEEVFNNYELHNKVGAILQIQRYSKPFIQAYFVKNGIKELNKYISLVYLGITHDDIIKQNEQAIQEEYNNSLEALSNNNLYNGDNKETAFRQLLRRNTEAYTDNKQPFDFQIWKERSLEHIYPKSKEIELGDFKGNGGIHCIGNLVLLYKNDNSSFNASSFDDKKAIYFDLEKRKGFKSRNLLHTISIFASGKWGIKEIQNNKEAFIEEFKQHYKEINAVKSNE